MGSPLDGGQGGLDTTMAPIAETLTLQTSRIGKFVPTPTDELASLPIDPTGLLARTLPIPSSMFAAPTYTALSELAVYDTAGALHFADDPIAATELFSQTEIAWLASTLTTVYQTSSAEAARQVVDQLAEAANNSGGRSADPVDRMPESYCLQGPDRDSDPGLLTCFAPAQQYAIEASGRELRAAHQRTAAQFRSLTS